MNGLSDTFFSPHHAAIKSSLLIPNAGSYSLISTFAKTKEKAKKTCFAHQKIEEKIQNIAERFE